MNTMLMTLKWEVRKQLEACKIPLFIMAVIFAGHQVLPFSKGWPGTDSIRVVSILVFYLIGWYLFLVYPITSLLNNFRGPYSTLERMTPRPFGQTLVIRMLSALLVSAAAFFAMNLEKWGLGQMETDFFSYFKTGSISFEDAVSTIWRVGIVFPQTAVFSWMVLHRWISGKWWLEICSILLFLLLIFFYDMLLILDASMGSRLGTIVLKGCYVGLLFWGAVKCYEG